MTALLRAELLKLRTTRTFVALAVAAVALPLVAIVLFASLTDVEGHPDVRLLFTSDLSRIFVLLLGVIAMAGEWRHRTMAGSVLAAPNRMRLLAAKILSCAMAGVLLSLAATVLMMVAGTLILSARGLPTLGLADLADVLWRNLALAAAAGALGVGVGALVRNQVVAVAGLLMLGFVVEPPLLAQLPELGRFGPLLGAPSGIAGDTDPNLLGLGPALAVTLAWPLGAIAAGAALLRRRDLV
jgi:ABC-2 type transport system permease protein